MSVSKKYKSCVPDEDEGVLFCPNCGRKLLKYQLDSKSLESGLWCPPCNLTWTEKELTEGEDGTDERPKN